VRLLSLTVSFRTSITALDTSFLLLLTGTPIQNSMAELYSIMNLVRPEVYNNLAQFLERFGDPPKVMPSPEQLQDLQVCVCVCASCPRQSSYTMRALSSCSDQLVHAHSAVLARAYAAGTPATACVQEELRPILLRRMKEDVETLPEKVCLVLMLPKCTTVPSCDSELFVAVSVPSLHQLQVLCDLCSFAVGRGHHLDGDDGLPAQLLQSPLQQPDLVPAQGRHQLCDAQHAQPGNGAAQSLLPSGSHLRAFAFHVAGIPTFVTTLPRSAPVAQGQIPEQ
jgi:SNF2-related domain